MPHLLGALSRAGHSNNFRHFRHIHRFVIPNKDFLWFSKLVFYSLVIMPPPLGGALSDDGCLTSDVCLSVAYIGPKSRTERLRKTKNWHRGSPRHTWLGHHFQGQKVKGQGHRGGAYCGGLPHSLLWLKTILQKCRSGLVSRFLVNMRWAYWVVMILIHSCCCVLYS